MSQKFTKDSILAEILKFPEAEKVLAKYNLPCLSCPWAKFELENLKVSKVCEMYGIGLENILKELNKRLKPKIK